MIISPLRVVVYVLLGLLLAGLLAACEGDVDVPEFRDGNIPPGHHTNYSEYRYKITISEDSSTYDIYYTDDFPALSRKSSIDRDERLGICMTNVLVYRSSARDGVYIGPYCLEDEKDIRIEYKNQ